MRVQQIKIDKWRHFRNIHLTLPAEAPIICIVGANGTGKSQILELIAACAHHLGLTPGTQERRGNPFADEAEFSLEFFIASDTVANLETDPALERFKDQATGPWDRTLTISKATGKTQTITAGGVGPRIDVTYAKTIVEAIKRSTSIHYLFLDADRAYPKIQVDRNRFSEAFEKDWETTKKPSSSTITHNLYEEWIRFLLGTENQKNNEFVQQIRLARESGRPEPSFVDHFSTYKNSIKKVLPHLLFLGVNSKTREIRFDSTGLELAFDQLSGGEREIAFLIGQIERFSLRKGLLLVDEPELHLNYDLLRAWITFLKESVEKGQIWLATHSLEVVEVAGRDATFILERDEQTRNVISARSLSSQPIVATLSRAVGSPAFSIANLAFVFVEGEEEIGERERFRLLCDAPPHVRLLEAGSCKEVVRRLADLRDLACESAQTIRVGGVVDRDLRARNEQEELVNQGIFVLGVHEIENFFLHPPTLKRLMQDLGRGAIDVEAWIRDLPTSEQGLGFSTPRGQTPGCETCLRHREKREPLSMN